MVELKNIEKIYKNGKNSFLALKNINIKFGSRGLVIILGKSGSGKSTLLNILGGLDSHTNGEIIIDDKNIKEFKNKDYDNYRNNYVGFVFQEFNLINEITINENVEIPLKLKNIKDKTTKIDDVLTKVGLSNIGHKKCNELSGGQRQRVAIARTLVKDPRIVLADEPTGALDSSTSIEIFELFKKIAKDKLVVIVTHNEDLAYNYADRIIKISDGNIVEDITRIHEEKIKKIASNVVEVDSDYVLTKKDIKDISSDGDYVGVTTNLHDLTLAYDEILDYKKENKEDFIKTSSKEENIKEKFDDSNNSLSFIDAYELAKDNLKKNAKKYRFLKTIFTCFSMILIVAFIISMLNINSFVSKQVTSKNSLNLIKVSHAVTKTKPSEINDLKNILDNDNYSYVNNYALTPYYGNNIEDSSYVSENFNGIIEGINPNKLGLELVEGSFNLENNYQIIISDYMAYNFSKYGVLALNEDKLQLLYATSNKELIGKLIKIKETDKYYKIIGIYKTNFLSLLSKCNKGEDVSYLIDLNTSFLYSKVYAKIGFYKQYKNDYKDYSFYEEGKVYRIDLVNEEKSNRFYFSDTRVELNKDKIGSNINYYNLNGEISDIPTNLNDNEIILSIEHINEMFAEENKTIQELLHTTEIYTFLTNKDLTLNLLQNNSHSSTDTEDVSIVKDINVKIVGILDEGNRLFASNNICDILNKYLEGYDSVYFKNSSNSLILENKLKDFDSSIVVGSNLVDINDVENIEEIVNGMSSAFTAFAIIFLFLSFIVCSNYMNIIVRTRFKELILYRTLGAKKTDIYKIFIFESMNISIKSIIGGIIGSYIIIYILNNILSSISVMKIANLNILSFNILYCFITLICVFAICLFASYLSVRSLLNKKLVDAFKVN